MTDFILKQLPYDLRGQIMGKLKMGSDLRLRDIRGHGFRSYTKKEPQMKKADSARSAQSPLLRVGVRSDL